MSDLLKKLNEMEARHSMEIKELREVIEKEEAPKDEMVLGGMFRVRPDGDGWSLVDEYLMEYQTDRLRAIDRAQKDPWYYGIIRRFQRS
jgi:hypothetical protein